MISDQLNLAVDGGIQGVVHWHALAQLRRGNGTNDGLDIRRCIFVQRQVERINPDPAPALALAREGQVLNLLGAKR